MLIHLRERQITFDGATLKTRSKELIRFVAYLAWRRRQGAGAWIGIDDMRGVTGSAEPKQYQRYLDSLEQAGLAVVEYDHKTKGPWRLSEKIRNVTFDLPDDELAHLFQAAPDNCAVSGSRSGEDTLYDFVSLCAEADASFHDGNLSNDDDHSALAILSGRSFFTPPPPTLRYCCT